MGPLDDIYTITYENSTSGSYYTRSSTGGTTATYDGTKWVPTPVTPTRDPSGKFIIPPVDLTKQIKDIHIQYAVVELLGADRVENVDEQIERINDAIRVLSEAVVKRLGTE